MKFKLFIPAVFILLFFADIQLHAKEIDILKRNYANMILSDGEEELIDLLITLPREKAISEQMVTELMQRYPPEEADILYLLDNLLFDGSWKDIDYSDNKRTGWEPRKHVNRILELAKVYRTRKSSFYDSQRVEQAIHLALNFWFEKKPVCLNWWYNEIGVPKTLGNALILFEDRLTSSEKDAAVEAMSISKFGMTGQNKVWLAGNVLVRGMLQNDLALIKQARDTIVSEIVIGGEEGIQADNSFHQHGPQQQFGNYGAAFIAGMSFWCRVFGGTSLTVDQQKLDIIAELVHEGYRRILWKGFMDVNALDRQLFRQAQPHKAFSVAFSSKALADTDILNRSKYMSLLSDNFVTRSNPEITGVYHFWRSDQTICRRQDWMASVKMSSFRVIGAEAGNGDNMKGYYTADGATYTYVDGDEYGNIFPTWDWRKIPGITSYEADGPLNVLTWAGYRNADYFAGNVNDGNRGLTAMSFYRDGLHASKSWIFTDRYILCLGAGIRSDSGCVVTTSIDQRLKRSDLLFLNKSKWAKVTDINVNNKKNTRFFHDKTGYIILQGEKITAKDETRIGSWREVMQMYPEEMKEENQVISLWLDHGKDPENAGYQYIILPGSTTEEIKSFNTETIRIISNDKNAQIVFLPKEKIVFIAAYRPVDVKLPLNVQFKTLQAGLFMLDLNRKGQPEITVSDPTQKLDFINLIINKREYKVSLPSGKLAGTSAKIQ